MNRGVLDTIQLAATVAFAIPVGVAGVSLFGGGQRVLGGVLLAVAVGMVLIEEYITTPTDVPAAAAEKAAGLVAKSPDDEEE